MIEARHNRAAQWIFDRYIMRLLKKSFAGFHWLGSLPQPKNDLPLLLLPNHSTWWDGFFVYLVNRQLWGRKLFMMMLDEQLRRYWFFRYLGAYGITPDQPKSILQSLRYSAALLQRPDNPMVCIYPQGQLTPWGKRPLNYAGGIERIIKMAEKQVNLLQLAMKVEMCEKQKPEVFFQAGEILVVEKNNFMGMEKLEILKMDLLDQLQQNITTGVIGSELLANSRKNFHIGEKG